MKSLHFCPVLEVMVVSFVYVKVMIFILHFLTFLFYTFGRFYFTYLRKEHGDIRDSNAVRMSLYISDKDSLAPFVN